MVAYAGDEVYCQRRCYYTNRIAEYAEPLPDVYEPGLDRLGDIGVTVNKLILLDEEEKLVRLRPKLAAFLSDRASFTSAVPGMLEVLPPGASKGYGVMKLLEHMNISAKDTIAFGDGENDIEMLELVGYGVAVENAKDQLKRIAKFGTKTNDEFGVASILELLSVTKE